MIFSFSCCEESVTRAKRARGRCLFSSIVTRRGKGRALLLDRAGPEATRWNERGGWTSDCGAAVVVVTRTG